MKRVVFCLVLIACASMATAQSKLSVAIDSLIATLPPESEVGIAVYDLTARDTLYAFRDKKLSRPASTMKLLTTITALSYLDAEEPFKTEVWAQGVIENDTLKGDLYVVGGFDPEFGDEGMNALVGQIAALPFRTISGKVYGDVSMKDSLHFGSGWAWDDNPESYQPYLSPLMYDKGTVNVVVVPGVNKGDTATVDVMPTSSYYTVRNEAITRTPSEGKFSIDRDWINNGNEIVIKGNVDQRKTRELNLYSSQDYFMHTFMERLKDSGIDVDSEYSFSTFENDSLSCQLAVYNSSFQAVIDQILKKSDNLNAEALLCKIGAASGKKSVSASDGLAQVNRLIKRLGHNPLDYKIADGSGLSNYNYISPRLLLDLLIYAYNDTQIFPRLYKALPTSGMEGTIKNRMKPGRAYKNVHAKTGSFTGINALAGYAQAANGHILAFSIMNQNVLSGRKARIFQDQVCEVLCEYVE